MTDSPTQAAARARAKRRKRLQQRQTVIFGSIIAVLLGTVLFAGVVWAGIVPSPIDVELNTPEEVEAPRVTQPCPPEGATPVPFEEISVNVLNSTNTSGLGARTGDALRNLGLTVETIGNASDTYLGSAKILVGPEYVEYAYTVAGLISDAQIVIDTRTEAFVDVVLGSGFTEVRSSEDFALDPDEPIPAPAGCMPLTEPGADDSDGTDDADDGTDDADGTDDSSGADDGKDGQE